MRFFGWIGSLALFWILVELSFLELLLPEVNAPLVLIALILALVVTLDQQWALGWAVGITFIFDIIRSGDITLLSLFFVVTAYGLFFLSQRLLFTREHVNHLLLSVFALGVTVIYEILFPAFSWPRWTDLILIFPIWFLVAWSVEKLNSWVTATSFSEFRGMRHS